MFLRRELTSDVVEYKNDGPARTVVVLQRRPRLTEVDGLLQHHLLRSGRLKDDDEVILELEHLAERQRDGDDRTLTKVVPGSRLPPGRQVANR